MRINQFDILQHSTMRIVLNNHFDRRHLNKINLASGTKSMGLIKSAVDSHRRLLLDLYLYEAILFFIWDLPQDFNAHCVRFESQQQQLEGPQQVSVSTANCLIRTFRDYQQQGDIVLFLAGHL